MSIHDYTDNGGEPMGDPRERRSGPAWDPFREYPEETFENAEEGYAADDYPNGRPPEVPGLAPHAGTNLRGDPMECRCRGRCICGAPR